MEHPSRNPEDQHRNNPEREGLSPGEIDLTGVVPQEDALRDVIGDAITEAEAASGDVPEWGARTIARALANRLDNPLGALHHFAVTGKVRLTDMAAEMASLFTAGDDETRQWVSLLGSHLVSRVEQEPVTKPDATEAPTETQIAAGLREHGDAFRAFLRLPDAERHSAEMLANFSEFYVGSFTTMAELLEKLTDVRQGMEAVAKTAEDWGLEGCVGLDRAALIRAARDTWDIVELGDSLYVFMK